MKKLLVWEKYFLPYEGYAKFRPSAVVGEEKRKEKKAMV